MNVDSPTVTVTSSDRITLLVSFHVIVRIISFLLFSVDGILSPIVIADFDVSLYVKVMVRSAHKLFASSLVASLFKAGAHVKVPMVAVVNSASSFPSFTTLNLYITESPGA